MFGDITIKSRPLRLAFVVPPNKTVLREVLLTSFTLWGGLYNPIIPLYKRAPESWRMYPTEKISISKRVLGYINAFDPDFLVNCTGADLPGYIRDLKRTVISLSDVWKAPPTDNLSRTPQYGVGPYELLDAIYDEYFAVVQRFPVKLVLPVLPEKHKLFWEASVGEFAPAFLQPMLDVYSDDIDIEQPTFEADTYASITGRRRILPRDIVRYHIKVERGSPYDRACAFYMDADSFMDIVDFWNLRALGRAVMPVPKQFIGIESYLDLIRKFLRDQFRISRHNPQITYGANLIRSSTSSMKDLEDFVGVLDLAKAFEGDAPGHAMPLQHWYPRIWDEWAIGKDNARPALLSNSSESVNIHETDSNVSFSLVAPDFRTDSPMTGPRYANEIYPKFYGDRDDIRAEVLPYEYGDRVLRATVGPIAMRGKARIGRTGLVYLVDWKSRTSWDVPLAQDIFFGWLADQGYPSKLSTCGLLAKEINAQLDGWVNVLTNEPLLQLLETMNKGDEDGKGVRLQRVRQGLHKLDSSDRLFDSLVDRKIFQLGYRSKCPHCGRSSWHSVDALGAELSCPLCYKRSDVIKAMSGGGIGHWHLRTAGGFSVKDYGQGSYCVLLTLNFFKHSMRYQTTPAFSFEPENPEKPGFLKLEADFAMLWQERAFGETQHGVLFAECKSYNKFEKRDYDRMRALAHAFPGAVLAFCTLRKTLEPDEKRAISRIVRTGMKHWKADRPLNPVLILTGTELFSLHEPPYCWDDLTVPQWAQHPRNLLEVCNATQSLYLDLPPWYEVWEARSKSRQRQRQTQASTRAAARRVADADSS